jgi:CheY-like chemotaxis protein
MTSTKKILVVEDDGMLRKVMSDKLRVLGYDVYQAEDGQEAIDLILDKRPNLVLLDLLIPKIDGFTVLQKIREYPDAEIANTRVMVLSNLWTDKDILRVKSLKIDEYFVKAQTDLEEVFNKVKNLLN